MKAFVVASAVAGGVWGVWHSLQPHLLPFWPGAVAEAMWCALSGALGAWMVGRAVRSRWAAVTRLVDRILHENQDVTP